MCQGLTQSAGGLYACRFIMGALEGSLGPGAALLMGQYYRRHEFGPRFACFFVCALASTAVSSVSASCTSHLGCHLAFTNNSSFSSFLHTQLVIWRAFTASAPGAGSSFSKALQAYSTPHCHSLLFPRFPKTPSSSQKKSVAACSNA